MDSDNQPSFFGTADGANRQLKIACGIQCIANHENSFRIPSEGWICIKTGRVGSLRGLVSRARRRRLKTSQQTNARLIAVVDFAARSPTMSNRQTIAFSWQRL